jgi:tetratricopeptide (TPR) repeat protein
VNRGLGRGTMAIGAAVTLFLACPEPWLPGVRARMQDARAEATPPPDGALAMEALLGGDYDRAREAARSDLASAPDSESALRVLFRVLMEKGAYPEAEEAVRVFVSKNPGSGAAWNLMGEVLSTRGRRSEAETAFARAVAAKSVDALAAEASLGILLYERGLRAEGVVHFERLISAYNEGRASTASDLIAVGRASRYLGASNPASFRDALKAFDEAAALDPTHQARLRTGDLFLEKFNGTEARSAFEAVLERNPHHPQALLGMARARDFDGEGGVPDLIDAALETNPSYVEALAYRSGLFLALEDFSAARIAAQKALAVNPSSPEALSALAAAEYVSGDMAGFAETRGKAEAAFPKSAELLVTVAEAAVRNRLYREAEGLAREALKLDPHSWAALASLGQNQLRLGDIEGARRSLEASFAGDPYNVWVKNTLDLMDTFVNYETVRRGRFELFLNKKEAGVLVSPMEALATEAMEKLSVCYGFSPTDTIRVEARRRVNEGRSTGGPLFGTNWPTW